MKKFINPAKMRRLFHNPYLSACLISLILTICCCIICDRLAIFSSFSPTDLHADENVDTLYEQGKRYVSCTAPALYYTGYDYTSHGKVQAHYYYSLNEDNCTIYLIANDFIQDASVPLTLTDVAFHAVLRRNDKNLKPLLEYMAADLGWNYSGLSKHTSLTLISMYHYHPFAIKFVGCLTLIGFFCCLLFLCLAIIRRKNYNQ